MLFRSVSQSRYPDVKFEVFGYLGDDVAGCLFYCNDTRNRVLYLNSKGVEEAYAMGLVSVERDVGHSVY